MAIKSNAQKLINKTESLKVSLQDTDFVLVVGTHTLSKISPS